MTQFRLPGIFHSSLASVVLLYLVMIILMLVFAATVLGGMEQDTVGEQGFQLALLLAIPLFLLASLLYSLFYAWKKIKLRSSHYRFTLRLFLTIFFVIILISLPQTVLSLHFVDMTFSKWFGKDVQTALKSGLDIALEHYQDLKNSLKYGANNPCLEMAFKEASFSPEDTWKTLHIHYPWIEGMQILYENENFVFGDKGLSYPPKDVAGFEEGPLPKRTNAQSGILGYLRRIHADGKDFSLLLYRTVPREFDSHAKALARALDKHKQFNEYAGLFRIGIFLFYMVFLVPMLFLGLVLALSISQRVIRPFQTLEDAARQVAGGDYNYRLLRKENDDFAFLTKAFNAMIKELEFSKRNALQVEKLSTWQDIAQRLAHEIRTPLTPIRLYAQRILHRLENDEEFPKEVIHKGMNRIISAVEDMNALLVKFRELASQKPPVFEKLNIRDFLENLLPMIQEAFPKIHIDTAGLKPDLFLQGDIGQLNQVFNNLFSNSIQAMEEEGLITIGCAMITKGYGSYCRISMADTGPGIPAEALEKIFMPYYTSRADGTGLGLSIVERIIHDHGGIIWVESVPGEGTVFYLDLPCGEEDEKHIDY